MEQSEEQQTWQRVRTGDKKSYEELFRAYYQRLVGYSCSMLKDLDEAEDVVQTLFFNLWSKRESLAISSSVKAYLYRSVHNDCLNRLKHGKVRQLHVAETLQTSARSGADSAQLLQAKELGRDIERALQQLPEQCGLVFRMNRFQHLKYAEIAEELNISVKTVENHMGKALRLLRVALRDHLLLLLLILSLN